MISFKHFGVYQSQSHACYDDRSADCNVRSADCKLDAIDLRCPAEAIWRSSGCEGVDLRQRDCEGVEHHATRTTRSFSASSVFADESGGALVVRLGWCRRAERQLGWLVAGV